MFDTSAIAVTIGGELIVLAAITASVIGDLWLLPYPEPLDTRLPLSQTRDTLWRLLGLGTILLAVTVALELLLRTANMSELPLRRAYTEIGTVLFKTHYGRLWLWRAAAVAGLMIIWLIQWHHGSRRRLYPVAAMIAVIVIVVSLSASGHAGDNGMISTANIADSLHILGALAWGGGILAFALVILPALIRDGESSDRAVLADSSLSLSNLAGIALALTILPGIYNAWSLVGSWHGLWTTLYGRLLVAKIILVAAMIALGAVNRYRFVPWLQVQAGRPRPRILIPLPRFMRTSANSAAVAYFLRTLRAEAILLLTVLTLAAALSQEMPAAHAEHGTMSEHAHAAVSR
jgi:putative copper resistance protein D